MNAILSKKNMRNIRNIRIARLPKNVKKIIKLAETARYSEIGKLYGVSSWNINKILREQGIRHRRTFRPFNALPVNIQYFKNIDSVKKAYWLGYLCADGKITSDKVMLCSKDKEIIEKFKKDIESGHAISKYSYFDKRTKKVYTQYIIQVGCSEFSKYVRSQGVTENKSNRVRLPTIKDRYIPFFVAGLFDGDGWVGVRRQICKTHITVTIRINIMSTKEMLRGIQTFIYKKYGIGKKALCRWNAKKSNKNVWYLTLYDDAFKFLSAIYKEKYASMYLSRKYSIFKRFRDVSLKKTIRGKYGRRICVE